MYCEDCVTKTHDGGLQDMRRDRKEVWIYPNSEIFLRCPVRLVQKYLSLCPKYDKKDNFYLKALQKPIPTQWYTVQVVGQNTLAKVIKELMKEADIVGYSTNHSAHRTGGTRLFRGGVNRKIIKEATGHSSDAVDKYQLTSDEQQKEMSRILAAKPSKSSIENDDLITESVEKAKKDEVLPAVIVLSQDKSGENSVKSNIESNKVCELINGLIKDNVKKGKSIIKVQIEISHE